MDDELEEELDEGKLLAVNLAKHLEAMGAQQCKIPVTTDDGCYIIKVTKTL